MSIQWIKRHSIFFCFKTKAKEDNALSSSVPPARETEGLILLLHTATFGLVWS